MSAYITSKYNTGWMPGDIKLATLSDTTVENIGVNSDELVVDDDNWVGILMLRVTWIVGQNQTEELKV